MKTMMIALATLLTNSAFAYEYTNWPTLGGVEVNQLCQGSDSIRSLKAVKKCAKYETRRVGGKDGGTETECVKYTHDYVRIPYTYQKTSCVDYKTIGGKDNKELVCTKWATKTVTTPVDFVVGVYRKALGKRDNDNGDHLLYSFEYSIPSCN